VSIADELPRVAAYAVWTGVLERKLSRSGMIGIVLTMERQSVDDFVTEGTSKFNTNKQFSTRRVQGVQYQSIKNCRFQ
jgi:hypothetical protein